MTTATRPCTPPAHLLEGEEAVKTAARRYNQALQRIDDLRAQVAALTAQIAQEPDAKRLAKLRNDRRDTAAELEHAPADAVSHAAQQAEQQTVWAANAASWFASEMRQINEALAEPTAAAAQARSKLSMSRPADSVSPEEQAALEQQLNRLAGPLAALHHRARVAQQYRDLVRTRTEAMFGDVENGSLTPAAGAVHHWLATVRTRAEARATTPN